MLDNLPVRCLLPATRRVTTVEARYYAAAVLTGRDSGVSLLEKQASGAHPPLGWEKKEYVELLLLFVVHYRL